MSPRITLEYDRRPSVLATMLRAATPAARRADLDPGIGARWRGHRVDRDRLSAFLRLTGTHDGPTLPLLYPLTFGFPLTMAVLTHPAFPVPIWGVLQTRNLVVQHRPVARDATFDIHAVTRAGRVVAKGAEIDVHTTVLLEGELAWESVVTFLLRGRFGESPAAAPGRPAPEPAGPEVVRWTTDGGAPWAMGSFTGDYNGVHLWDFYARRFGFPRAFHHPSRVVAMCLARLPSRPSPTRLEVWLKGPVAHGASVRLHAATTPPVTAFSLFVQGAARPAIAGRSSWGAPSDASDETGAHDSRRRADTAPRSSR